MVTTRDAAVERAMAHEPRLMLTHDAREEVHGTHRLGQWNNRLALRITRSVGSMWCAYAFACLALISLPAAIRSHDPIVIVAWVAQTFLQLVLLPIIIVGQNVQAAASDAQAKADHATLNAVHTLTKEIHTLSERHAELLARLER